MKCFGNWFRNKGPSSSLLSIRDSIWLLEFGITSPIYLTIPFVFGYLNKKERKNEGVQIGLGFLSWQTVRSQECAIGILGTCLIFRPIKVIERFVYRLEIVGKIKWFLVDEQWLMRFALYYL